MGLSLCACTSETKPKEVEKEETNASENSILQKKERGPVQVTLKLEPKEATFADRLRFTVTAEAEENVEVTLPPVEQFQGNFLIKDYLYYPPEKSENGLQQSRQEYVIEVLTSGDYTLPSLKTTFVDNRPKPKDDQTQPGPAGPPDGDTNLSETPTEDEERVFSIVSDPIEFKVKELENPESLQELKPIDEPYEPEVVPPSWKKPIIYSSILAGSAVLLGILLFLIFRKKVDAPPPPPVPPEELAYKALEWLLAQQFPQRGELKEFFFHLSRIVREYIEGRFGLRAPERTTEEFLEDLAHSPSLTPDHKKLLKHFLEKADEVKFAKHVPTSEEIEESFNRAKQFIEETKPRPNSQAGGEAKK